MNRGRLLHLMPVFAGGVAIGDFDLWMINNKNEVFGGVRSFFRKMEIKQAYQSATNWILKCQNQDGGFSHFPDNAPSDVDAVYFHIGGLVESGYLKPVNGIKNEEIYGWGHLMDPDKTYNCLI